MGVIYKLKKEVVQVIVEKKKNDPSLSCRKIAALLKEVFHIEVSKSSINAVIKEYKLSSPVGRKPSQNFYIPKDKKDQLLAQVIPFLPDANIVQPVPCSTTEGDLSENGKGIELPAEVQTEGHQVITQADMLNPDESDDFFEDIPELLKLGPDRLRNSLSIGQFTQERPIDFVPLKDEFFWSGEKGPIFENMGIAFLEAVLSDSLRRPMVSTFLSQDGRQTVANARMLEAVILFTALGRGGMVDAHAVSSDVVWTLLDLDRKKGQASLEQFLEKDFTSIVFRAAIEAELELVFLKNGYFCIKTNGGHNYFLSDDLTQIFETAPTGSSFPMIKAIDDAVDRVVFPIKPLVFNCPQGLVPAVRKMISVLNGSGAENPEKISLWGKNNNLIWESDIKAGRKICFIAGFDEEQFSLENIEFEVIKNPQSIYNSILDKKYNILGGSYRFTPMDGEADVLRAVVVSLQGKEKKIIFLTNIESENHTVTSIINDNLAKLLNFKIEDNDNKTKKYIQETLNKSIHNEEDGTKKFTLQKLVHIFEEYIKYKFLDIEDHGILQSLYCLSGYFQQRQGLALIRLILPEGFSYTQQVETLINRINSNIFEEHHNKRWHFSIEKASL